MIPDMFCVFAGNNMMVHLSRWKQLPAELTADVNDWLTEAELSEGIS